MSFSHPRRTRGDGAAAAVSKLKSNVPLPKGSTFHSPVTPPLSPASATTLKVPSLPRRSQTCLDDVVDAHRRRAALNIDEFEKCITAAKLPSGSSARDNTQSVSQVALDNATMAPTEVEKRVLRPRSRRSRPHESDSGLGTSIASAPQKKAAGVSAITRSATPMTPGTQQLSTRSVNRIHEHTLKPLLAKASLKEFRPIVLDCPRRIHDGQIVCLRDLEKTLMFMAPEKTKSVDLYLEFCLTSIRCIQATVEYLPDREQTRPDDRPYSAGYFIDLVEQLHSHAAQMRDAQEKLATGGSLGEMDAEITDEVKLVGGLATSGRPAELVRVKKNGKAVSLATGEVVDDVDEKMNPHPTFKRELSASAEDAEEVLRSMARRKKNPTPEELAPKKCKHHGCTKEFKRPCDLTKHEKTHSRPFKCPDPKCKYHEFGWPTEKEMDRHYNDKHMDSPNMYECHFKPCPYKSKRESNCKQHMEKAHGWTYVRTKTNGKKEAGSKAGDSAHPTPIVHNLPTPVSVKGAEMPSPEDPVLFGNANEFPTYLSDDQFNAQVLDSHQFPVTMPPLEFSPEDFNSPDDFSSPTDNATPSTDVGQFANFQDINPDLNSPDFGNHFGEDIYGAHAQLPSAPDFAAFHKMVDTSLMNFAAEACPTAAPHISPVGQGNTMLYTPQSMVDVDEGFDDMAQCDQYGGDDFMLFPPGPKAEGFDDQLFNAVPPSLAGGFTQPSSQDFNIDFTQQMEWANDFRPMDH